MKKKGILIVLLVLAVILAAGSMFTVAEDEYACTVRFPRSSTPPVKRGCTSSCPLWTA